MVATICGSYAFMLPIATPPNAIAVSSSALKIKEMMKLGFVFNLLGITLVSSLVFLALVLIRASLRGIPGKARCLCPVRGDKVLLL